MTTRLYTSLNERHASSKGMAYRSYLGDKNKRLKIDVYDSINPPRKHHDKRMNPGRLEEIAKEVFTGIDFVCDTCADNGVMINFAPKKPDHQSQKYFGHQICIDENSALTIVIHIGKDTPTLPDAQRTKYNEYASRIITEYISRGKNGKKQDIYTRNRTL
ncbi:MAG: hypothetical protein ACP5NW_03975 [Candidatus Woesearchaeota archaeon]